ncbi:hypothetical protein SMIR_42435 (plasmid) [Streptomyces mirabilis]|uniref:hypothetical protein n=1 Tax=Streptomyces mirabilis TaxID=68239 RepID=UPI001BAE838D|nr:hypothetical protein [Streptomyces mirabilis]QUW85697.1 hypothetical protein SMIR_42435 [Streptomyces mirabilis]
MNIELLVVPDCPHEKPAAEQLRHTLDDLGLHGVAFATRVISDQAQAEEVGFAGSPTLLIEGRDPFAEPSHPVGLTCRMYRTAKGLAGLPDPGRLRQALAAASTD